MVSFLNLALDSASGIGRSVKGKRMICLKDLKRSTYTIGTHGSGKSTLAFNQVYTDITLDDKGIVVFDAHGDLVKDIKDRCPPEHVKRLIYFSPSEQSERILGLNPFELVGEHEYELKVGALMDVFAHTWYGGFGSTPTLQNTLETLVRTLVAAYPTHETNFLHMLLVTRLDDVGRSWRQRLSVAVKDNPSLTQNWAEWRRAHRFEDDIESSRQKIKHIIASDPLKRILCQPRSAQCFDFQKVLSNRGVILVNLEGLDDEGQRLLGSIILSQLHVMAKLRARKSQRIPCHIYADEFYKFAPQSFVNIINEDRKFGLFCTLAHQNLEQLNKEARAAAANCGNIIVFRVNPEDADLLSKHFLTNGQLLPSKILSNLPRFHAIVRYEDHKYRRQALIRTFPKRGSADMRVGKAVLTQSEAYGTSIEDINQYIYDKLDIKGSNHEKTRQQGIKRKPRPRPKPKIAKDEKSPKSPDTVLEDDSQRY